MDIQLYNSSDKFKEYFFSLAIDIYSDDNIWMGEDRENIARLFDKKNYYPIIVMDGEVLARAIAIYNDNKIAWIAMFECKTKDAGILVLNKCEDILRELGTEVIVGPKLDNLQLGLLIKGYKYPQSILSNYNPKYYARVFKKAGYKIKFRTYAFYLTRKSIKKFKFQINDEIVTREFDPDNLEREIHIFNNLNKQIFSGTNDYVDRTIEEERELIISLLPIIDPRLIVIAEDKNNNPIGFIIALPDANQMRKEGKIDRLRIISIGVVPEWQRKKVGAHLGAHLYDNVIVMENYQYAEASFILERNLPSQLLARKFNAKVGRTFALFEKKL